MKFKISKLKIAILVGIMFFIAGLFTLKDYNINWDTINHLPRGQAYLHFFTTGKKDYSDMQEADPALNWYWQDPASLTIKTDMPSGQIPTRSMYQSDGTPFSYFIQHDGDGHPPLSDILSAAFNRILFGKLHLINDIDSYHVYGIFLAACLVGLMFYWVSKTSGVFAGITSALILALYPLFFSESHFNTEKDIPEVVYWSFMIFCVWKGVTQKSAKWIILSGIFFGLAFGTKFNILFAPVVILPWLIVYITPRLKTYGKNNFMKLLLTSTAAFITGVIIFVGTWPYLWADPIGRFQKVLDFYKQIGTTAVIGDPRFNSILGSSSYTLAWITYTTPILVLILFIVGTIYMIYRLIKVRKDQDKVYLLFLLWFWVPVARTTVPGSAIYGGVRQLMEYVPAMAIIAGIGASSLLTRLKITQTKLKLVLVVLISAILVYPIIEYHPNENVYFNALIGGLQGARNTNIPFWGFSFGAPYRQAAEWINKNAPLGANVTFAYELQPNIPRIFFRRDLGIYNATRSGYLRLGEYSITLIYQGVGGRSYYQDYLEKFLDPVYVVSEDGVPILKVWKNDNAHLKLKYKEALVTNPTISFAKDGLQFDLKSDYKIARLELNYSQQSCKPLTEAYIEISSDGLRWTRLPGDLPDDWRIPVLGQQPNNGKLSEPFLGQEAKYIKIFVNPSDSCLKKVQNFKIYSFL